MTGDEEAHKTDKDRSLWKTSVISKNQTSYCVLETTDQAYQIDLDHGLLEPSDIPECCLTTAANLVVYPCCHSALKTPQVLRL